MNSIVSAAAVATATAIPNESIAAATVDSAATSFPDLVARLIRIHERWSAQRGSDEAWSKKIDRLFFEATGISMDERLAVDWRSELERFRQLDAVLVRIFKENPNENDPSDKDGASIAWSEINDEILDVASDILSRHPLSVADLAWQAEAIALAEVNLPDTTGDVPLLPGLFANIRTLAAQALRVRFILLQQGDHDQSGQPPMIPPIGREAQIVNYLGRGTAAH